MQLPCSGKIQSWFAKAAEFQEYQWGYWVMSYLPLKTNKLKVGAGWVGGGAITAERKEGPDAGTGKSPIAGGGGHN